LTIFLICTCIPPFLYYISTIIIQNQNCIPYNNLLLRSTFFLTESIELDEVHSSTIKPRNELKFQYLYLRSLPKNFKYMDNLCIQILIFPPRFGGLTGSFSSYFEYLQAFQKVAFVSAPAMILPGEEVAAYGNIIRLHTWETRQNTLIFLTPTEADSTTEIDHVKKEMNSLATNLGNSLFGILRGGVLMFSETK